MANPRDIEYSQRFWARGQPNGMHGVMCSEVEKSYRSGRFGHFVSSDGITESDKETLSAYRILAKELGYRIGLFTFDRSTGIATAPIEKSD